MKTIVDSCVFINAMKEDSEFRNQCLSFLEHMAKHKKLITMPAHGWFEVWCNFKRIEKIDKVFKGVTINGQWQFPLELIPIDAEFVSKYGNIELPYIKAADHIFVVVCYVNNYPLVTIDEPMTKKARDLGISVFTPEEYLANNDA